MDTIVQFSGERLVATRYGAYNTASGIAIALGNLAVGGLFDVAKRTGTPGWHGRRRPRPGCSAPPL
ncbi:hypothetical protein HRW07_02530 [Streptomyces lunaelactis]|uniref:hypothetical protein n=1 Tax=Streptomyces lunaelactis TaxID=1535768 RepID=UPI0015844DBA|nr:hypothetical protein [Streptomyces lunaelactis]NUL02140.1 hypothetical protein [Streptomyces lunaelactis]